MASYFYIEQVESGPEPTARVTLTANTSVKVADEDLLATSATQMTGMAILTGIDFKGISRVVFATRSAAATTTPTFRKALTRTLARTVNTAVSVAIARTAPRTLTAGVTSAGTLTRAISKRVSASVANSANMPRAMTRTLTSFVSGSLTVSKAVRKTTNFGAAGAANEAIRVAKGIQPTVASAPAITRQRALLHSLTTTVASASSFIKRINISRTATQGVVPNIIRRIVAALSITANATATPTYSRLVQKTSTATQAVTLNFSRSARKVVVAAATGAPSLSFTRTIGAIFTVGVGAVVSVRRFVAKRIGFLVVGAPGRTISVSKRINFAGLATPSFLKAVVTRLATSVGSNATINTVATFLSITFTQALNVAASTSTLIRVHVNKGVLLGSNIAPSVIRSVVKSFVVGSLTTTSLSARQAIVRTLTIAKTAIPSFSFRISKTNLINVGSAPSMFKLGTKTLSIGRAVSASLSRRAGKVFDILQPVSLPAIMKRATKTVTTIRSSSTTFARGVSSTMQRTVATSKSFQNSIFITRSADVIGTPTTNKAVRLAPSIITAPVVQLRKGLSWTLSTSSIVISTLNTTVQTLINTLPKTLSVNVGTSANMSRFLNVTIQQAITYTVISVSNMSRSVRKTILGLVGSSATDTLRVNKRANVTSSASVNSSRRVGKGLAIVSAVAIALARFVDKFISRSVNTASTIITNQRLVRTLSTVIGIGVTFKRAITRTISVSVTKFIAIPKSASKIFSASGNIQPSFTKRVATMMSRTISSIANFSLARGLLHTMTALPTTTITIVRARVITLVTNAATTVNFRRAVKFILRANVASDVIVTALALIFNIAKRHFARSGRIGRRTEGKIGRRSTGGTMGRRSSSS